LLFCYSKKNCQKKKVTAPTIKKKKTQPKMAQDIVIFGLPGCPYTIKAVTALARNGRVPFTYRSIRPDESRPAFWAKVEKYAPSLQLPKTFPTILVQDPQTRAYGSVYGSEGVDKLIADSEPVSRPSDRLMQNIQHAMSHSHNFVFVPKT
jgi:glutaredoxin